MPAGLYASRFWASRFWASRFWASRFWASRFWAVRLDPSARSVTCGPYSWLIQAGADSSR